MTLRNDCNGSNTLYEEVIDKATAIRVAVEYQLDEKRPKIRL